MRVADIALLEGLHEHLRGGLIVTSADTFEILRTNGVALAFGDQRVKLAELVGSRIEDSVPGFRELGLGAVWEEVAATGEPRYLPEVGYDGLASSRTWCSWSVHRADTERWGPVVVSLAVDVTERVAARQIMEEREARRVRLERAITAVPQPSLRESAAEVAQALVPAVSVEVCALRLLDSAGDLHLVAAAGFAPAEVRRIALKPISTGQIEAIRANAERHPFAPAFGLRRVDPRWLHSGGAPIGTLSVGSRSDRRLSEEENALLDRLAAQLAENLSGVDRSRARLRALSLQLGRDAHVAASTAEGRPAVLTRRQRAILGLYAEGLDTREVSELLVLSPHTVRTHVKLALRRLGVNSRKEALRVVTSGVDSLPIL